MLKTRRLILRPWREADADALYKYAKNPDVGPVAGWPAHTSTADSLRVIREILGKEETYALVLKETLEPIGSIGLLIGERSDLNIGEDEGEIGYWIGVPYWGVGLVPEALAALMHHAFVDLKLSALVCGYFEGNEKSRRVQDKCGFKYHHTIGNMPCPLLHTSRTEHVTRLKRQDWVGDHIQLIPAGPFDAERIHIMKYKAFVPLYAKYRDRETSPAKEPIEKVIRQLGDKASDYWIILFSEEPVGAIRIIHEEGETEARISPFFIVPAFQGLGIGQAVLGRIFRMYAGVRLWKLETLKQETKDRHIYEKFGFTKTGREQRINSRLSTIRYKKAVDQDITAYENVPASKLQV